MYLRFDSVENHRISLKYTAWAHQHSLDSYRDFRLFSVLQRTRLARTPTRNSQRGRGQVRARGLDGGVERAVKELLPGYRNDGNFWWWRNGSPTPPLGRLPTRLLRRFGPKALKRKLSDWLKKGDSKLSATVQDWWWRRQARNRMRARAREEATRRASHD